MVIMLIMAPLIDLDHVIDARRGFVRPIREGRETVGNIIKVGTCMNKDNASEITVVALCVRATSINENPAQVIVVINKKNDCTVSEKIKTISCTCPAGASKAHCCKHAIATLLYLGSTDENNLEKVTSTDVEQEWGKLKGKILERFNPVPFKEFCHIKAEHLPYKRSIQEITPAVEAEFRAKFLKSQPHCEAGLLLSGERHIPQKEAESKDTESIRSVFAHATSNTNYIPQKGEEIAEQLLAECSPELQEFYQENIVLTLSECEKLCEQTFQQSNSVWENVRYGRITGSICYSLFTYSKNKSPQWAKKLESVYNSNFEGNESTLHGKMFEKDGKECYEKLNSNSRIVTPGIIINLTVPWLAYSADGVIFVENVLSHLWECKSPVCGKKNGCDSVGKFLKYLDSGTGKLTQKHVYYGQVQLGMLITATESCEFTVYCSGPDEVHVEHITINGKFCLDLIPALAEVYFKHVLPWLYAKKTC